MIERGTANRADLGRALYAVLKLDATDRGYEERRFKRPRPCDCPRIAVAEMNEDVGIEQTAQCQPSPRSGNSIGWRTSTTGGYGILDRANVVLCFAESAEHRAKTRNEVRAGLFTVDADAQEVSELYDASFGRAPEKAGFDHWLGELRSGDLSLGQVADQFALSGEFSAKTATLSDGAFVDYLYETALRRAPDAAGAAFWAGEIAGGLSRSQVLLDFAQSTEHVALIGTSIDNGIVLQG